VVVAIALVIARWDLEDLNDQFADWIAKGVTRDE
jgi:hypothetical protein